LLMCKPNQLRLLMPINVYHLYSIAHTAVLPLGGDVIGIIRRACKKMTKQNYSFLA